MRTFTKRFPLSVADHVNDLPDTPEYELITSAGTKKETPSVPPLKTRRLQQDNIRFQGQH